MTEELKPNLVSLHFYCDEPDHTKCVYYSGDERRCKYCRTGFICTSAVAQVNAMTIKLKQMTGEDQ